MHDMQTNRKVDEMTADILYKYVDEGFDMGEKQTDRIIRRVCV